MKKLQLILWASCLLTAWTTLYADPWGQLFTTPVQRAQLDSGKPAPVKTDSATESGSGSSSQGTVVEAIQLTGTLTNSRGTGTVWLNGKPVTQGVRVLGAGRVQLQIYTSKHPHLLKSGQLIYPQSGEIVEGYTTSPVTQTDTTPQAGMESADMPM